MLDELRWTLRSLVIDALLIPEYRRSGVAFNPLSDRVIRNPYPAYARLRAAGGYCARISGSRA